MRTRNQHPITKRIENTIETHGEGACLHAFQMHREHGEGPSTVGFNLGVSTATANRLITAGRAIWYRDI